MASTGKYSLLYILLLIFHFSYIKASTDPQDSPDLTQILTLLNSHIHQLTMLDELVKNLTELVTRLEQQQQPCITRDQSSVSLNDAPVISDLKEGDQNDAVREVGLVTETTETRVERLGAVSVTKHSLFWSERFQFVSAVKLDTKPTSLNVLPFKDAERLSKYIAVGDDVGNLYVFTRYGEVMVRFDTGTGCSITSMVSYLSVVRNESIVVTGHENGVILVHKVWEVPNGDEVYSVQRETVRRLEQTSGLAISILEVHHVGRMRYIVSTDVSGTIKVFKEGGSVIGTIVPDNRPLVFLKQKLLFLTETGAGSLDLRSMKLREAPCEGLNGSHALNYVFDASDRGKAYGFTSAGELVHLLIYGDSMNFKCRVRSKKKFDVDHGPLAFEAIKAWHFFANKKEALTSWGPDDPFTNGPPTVPNERSFGDPTSRTHDIMDMRSGGGAAGGGSNGGDGGIRGLPRRYGSPTRYTGASSNSFRPTAIDPNPRPGTVDPDFIGSELKYRGPSMESSGFGKRREGLFVNSQVVDDHGS
ncbi:putative WD40-repeat-containing domain superfamily [Helianthus annuus]|nr:putative WD40-repeat-containing domain superfamily [Helianthus annuus]